MENDELKKQIQMFQYAISILYNVPIKMLFGSTSCKVNDEDTKVISDYYESLFKRDME